MDSTQVNAGEVERLREALARINDAVQADKTPMDRLVEIKRIYREAAALSTQPAQPGYGACCEGCTDCDPRYSTRALTPDTLKDGADVGEAG